MPVSCYFQGCKAPLFKIVSGAISSELPLPLLLTISRLCEYIQVLGIAQTSSLIFLNFWSASLRILGLAEPTMRIHHDFDL